MAKNKMIIDILSNTNKYSLLFLMNCYTIQLRTIHIIVLDDAEIAERNERNKV